MITTKKRGKGPQRRHLPFLRFLAYAIVPAYPRRCYSAAYLGLSAGLSAGFSAGAGDGAGLGVADGVLPDAFGFAGGFESPQPRVTIPRLSISTPASSFFMVTPSSIEGSWSAQQEPFLFGSTLRETSRWEFIPLAVTIFVRWGTISSCQARWKRAPHFWEYWRLWRSLRIGPAMGKQRASMDIAQLVAEHHQAVYRYAYRLAGTVADAEDLTQQVFLTAQAKLGQVRNEESVRSWLFAILRHRFARNCRQRKPIPAASIELNVENIPAEVPEAEAVDQESLQRALNELPPAYRTVVTMFYYEDCSYREISEKLQVPMGTVMSRLARAKAHLRSALFEADRGRPGEAVPKKATTRG